MKRILQALFMLCFCVVGLNAQVSYTEDFESYSVGDYIGSASADWTTWSGATGGAEDAQITSDFAASGNNSIEFTGAAGGGPQDVVLPFGGQYTSGHFNYSMNVYVPAGGDMYFNFQGQQQIGQQWTINGNLNADGSVNMTNGGNAAVLAGTYEQDTWTSMEVNIDLSANLWTVYINGRSLGSFINSGGNSVASLDLFPLGAGSKFYVDDVRFDYTPDAVTSTTDAAVIITTPSVISLAGQSTPASFTVGNYGSTPITSFDVDFGWGGSGTSQSVEGVNMMPGDLMTVELENPVNAIPGNNNLQIFVSNVNGANDDNATNDNGNMLVIGLQPAPRKNVFFEEGTGTWCGWCPRGDVFMNKLNHDFPGNFVGVAVHNGDPMTITDYDDGLTAFPGFTGFPGVIAERSLVLDPSGMETQFISRIQEATDVYMEHGATYDATTRELTISVTTNFMNDVNGQNSLIVVMTEDGVRGSGGGWDQANFYSGGGSGDLFALDGTNWADLANPVPASQVVYNHVARAILTDFNGQEAFGTSNDAGTSKTLHFTYTIPADYNVMNMHIVSAFRNVFGQIDNANTSSVVDAVDAGLSTSTFDAVFDAKSSVYPNPFSDVTYFDLNLEEAVDVTIEVTDATGRIVASRNYGKVAGNQVFPFNGSNLNSGIYYARIIAGDSFSTKRIIVSK